MQAIIMAAGKSTRTYPLTVNKPKPILKILDKTLLEHNLEALIGIVNEVIVIVGFKKEMIKAIGPKYKNITIRYVEQKSQLGTGHAIQYAKKCEILRLPRHLKDQMNRASSSIVLNLAEGSGKRTEKDKRHFYYIAFGSLRETQAILDLANYSENDIIELADKLGGSMYKLLRYYGPV